MFITTCLAYEDLTFDVRPSDNSLHVGLLCENRGCHINITISCDQALRLINEIYTALQNVNGYHEQEEEVA